MDERSDPREEWIRSRSQQVGNRDLSGRPVVFSDTTNYMSIERDHIIDLQGSLFLVRCNEREGRFGLEDQPKFWVKRASSLESGRTHILKLVFQEEFLVRVGPLQAKCVRSADKEARVLDLVRGDSRFMQGITARDSRGNLVRVIDFIPGTDLLSYLYSIRLGHEEYFHTLFPGILNRILDCLRGIGNLHEAGLCHGDIRNDHLLVERETGRYRWIDFDLTQDFSDFDVWSVGNILHCIVARGFATFREAVQSRPELSGRLVEEDASMFFPHRIMNLSKVYPYIPDALNRVLLRFSVGTRVYYENVGQIVEDLEACTAAPGLPETLSFTDGRPAHGSDPKG